MPDVCSIATESLEEVQISAPSSIPEPSLSDAVEAAVENYIAVMDGQEIKDLYELVLSEIEAPLLASVMKRVSHNQSRAS